MFSFSKQFGRSSVIVVRRAAFSLLHQHQASKRIALPLLPAMSYCIPQQIHWFVTAVHHKPLRRRRRSQPQESPERGTAAEREEREQSEEDDAPIEPRIHMLRPNAVTDPAIFSKEASKLMEKLYGALKSMEKHNDNFLLTRGTEDDVGDFLLLDLGPIHGQYTIQIDIEQQVAMMQSPISGQHVYVLSQKDGQWSGEEDGHSLEGLLVRDLIRQCNGVPDL